MFAQADQTAGVDTTGKQFCFQPDIGVTRGTDRNISGADVRD